MTRFRLNALLLLALALLLAPATSHAAFGYSNCTGFITTLPAVISTPGHWCFNQSLSTSISTGNAITVDSDDVTIDCNDFKLDGLAAGASTAAYGVFGQDRNRTTVRHCNIRGFSRGLYLSGSAGRGHVVEDNRADGNTLVGLQVTGDDSLIRHNRVFDTGGSSSALPFEYGIVTSGFVDVLDNTVSGVVTASGSNDSAVGIYLFSGPGGTVAGNRVRGLVKDGGGSAFGIFNNAGGRLSFRGNELVGDGNAGSVGMYCADNYARTKDNVMKGFATGITGCADDGGNLIKP